MNVPIENEQEAAVAILFASVLYQDKVLIEAEIEQLSRIMVLCSKFKGYDLNHLTKNAFSLHALHGSKKIIEQAAPFVSEDFCETLFAMACEIITADGKVNDQESELLATLALHMGISLETMKMMLTTYLIRHRWNVLVVDKIE